MEDLLAAHDSSRSNREEVAASTLCGCFHCLRTFPPGSITDWCAESDEGAQDTAMCPFCETDAVIASASGHPIVSEFLTRMHDHFFAPS